MSYPLGTVLISRNNDERLNTSPGYFNHLAVYVGNGIVVESQEGQGVIETSLRDYKRRDYSWAAIYPKDREVGALAAEKALKLVGVPHRRISSLFRRPRKAQWGMNCVSVIRSAYEYATGMFLPKLKRPDDVLNLTTIFES